eukprot:Pgem_evm2s9098
MIIRLNIKKKYVSAESADSFITGQTQIMPVVEITLKINNHDTTLLFAVCENSHNNMILCNGFRQGYDIDSISKQSLYHIDKNETVVSSLHGLGSKLTQWQFNDQNQLEDRIIMYSSRALKEHERKWPISELDKKKKQNIVKLSIC